MEFAVEIIDLTKRFNKISSLPKDVSTGPGQWILGLLSKYSSAEVDEIVAVDHVQIKIKKGEIFGLLGPNGAGKTTLLKCLATLLIPDEGTAMVNGHDIIREAKKVRKSINLVGSGHWVGFDWALTARENLEFFANIYGIDAQETTVRIDEALEVVGLVKWQNEVPDHLSGGMRQKLLIAKGLLVRTPVFLLDEPTVGLDPASSKDVRQYIKSKLSKELGVTILLSTHHMLEADQLCDRVAVMHNGRIVACDTPNNLKKGVSEQVRTEVIEIEVMNFRPTMLDKIQRLDQVKKVSFYADDPITGIGSIRIHCEKPEVLLQKTIQIVKKAKGRIRHIDTSGPTLEDVFMTLTDERWYNK